MKNFRTILLQIIHVMGLPPWQEGEVENFLAFAQVGAMVDIISRLPMQTPPRHPLRQCIIKLTG
jgi:hypothetical protein